MPSDIPIAILGNGAVGKSCLAIQYVQGIFVHQYDATVEELFRKPVDVDGETSILSIIDTAGQDGFEMLREDYMKRGRGFLFVYSITDEASLGKATQLYAQLKRVRSGAVPPIIVVGNKLDLDGTSGARQVRREEGEQFAETIGAHFIELSAKDKGAVVQLFECLVRAVRRAEAGDPHPFASPAVQTPEPTSTAAAVVTASDTPVGNDGGTSSSGTACKFLVAGDETVLPDWEKQRLSFMVPKAMPIRSFLERALQQKCQSPFEGQVVVLMGSGSNLSNVRPLSNETTAHLDRSPSELGLDLSAQHWLWLRSAGDAGVEDPVASSMVRFPSGGFQGPPSAGRKKGKKDGKKNGICPML